MSKLKFIKLITAEWCGPCHVIKNILARKGLKVDVIDLDESPELIKEFGIRSVLLNQTNRNYTIISY